MAGHRWNEPFNQLWHYMLKNGLMLESDARLFVELLGGKPPRNLSKVVKRMGRPGIDKISYVKCGFEPIKKLLNSGEELDRIYPGLGMPCEYWRFCFYGPSTMEDTDRVKKRLEEKGWRKTEEVPVQAEYCEWTEEEGYCLGWVEPATPISGSGMDWETSSEEEFDERGEDGDKVGATVLQILQRSTSESTTTSGETSRWIDAWIKRDTTLDPMQILHSEESGT